MDPENHNVKALIETKKETSKGFGTSSRVTWQQSAQVLTVIRDQSLPHGTPVFLISQEAKQFFVVVGTFGKEYLDYISGRTRELASKDFLELEKKNRKDGEKKQNYLISWGRLRFVIIAVH